MHWLHQIGELRAVEGARSVVLRDDQDRLDDLTGAQATGSGGGAGPDPEHRAVCTGALVMGGGGGSWGSATHSPKKILTQNLADGKIKFESAAPL